MHTFKNYMLLHYFINQYVNIIVAKSQLTDSEFDICHGKLIFSKTLLLVATPHKTADVWAPITDHENYTS